MLPSRLPDGVIVVLSARSQGDRCYLSEVGIAVHDIALNVTLNGFSADEVEELLVISSGHGTQLAENKTFVGMLHEFSAGDPFYLRFLVEDISRGIITAHNLKHVPQGYEQYLDSQFLQLGESIHTPQQQDILTIILLAEGPLSRNNLFDLVAGLTPYNFISVIRDIQRFLHVENEQYTFCHGRFKEYFAKKIGREQ